MPTSLQAFAAAVLAALPEIGTSRTERFGARKVFLSAVFAALYRLGYVMSPTVFRDSVLAAARAGLLSLARADLVAAMHGPTVLDSEIEDGISTFHFVIDPSAREAWETESASVGGAS